MDLKNENIYECDIGTDSDRSHNRCTFCSQFRYKDERNLTRLIFGKDFNRVLYEDENFVVVPALGQITEGYLLIISKDHFVSVANFPEYIREPFLVLKDKVRKVLLKEYSDPIFFEHGSYSPEIHGGASINHAHFHAVPLDIDLINTELNELNPVMVHGIQYLWNCHINHPYIYFETLRDKKGYFIRLDSNLPSQYVRRIIAREAGYPLIWNWHKYIGKSEVQNTVNKLIAKFI
jgi:diadenosine tetraphosphate (Ap4A) HIT family hydrolase